MTFTTYVYSPSDCEINLRTSDILYHANVEASEERRPYTALPYKFSTGYTCPLMAMNYTLFEDGSACVGTEHFPA